MPSSRHRKGGRTTRTPGQIAKRVAARTAAAALRVGGLIFAAAVGVGGFVLRASRPKGTIVLILYGALLVALSLGLGLDSVIRADAVPCLLGNPHPPPVRLGWLFGFESIIRPGPVPWHAGELYRPHCWSHREVGFLAAPNRTRPAV